MYRTLSDLQRTVNELVEKNGPNSLCVGFIFTPEDVNIQETLDDELLELDNYDLESTYPGIVDYTLNRLGDSSYLYELMNESIYDSVQVFMAKAKS